MTKQTNIGDGAIVPVDAPQLPATKAPVGKLKPFRRLCEMADLLVDEYEEQYALQRQVLNCRPGKPLPDVEAAQLSDHVKAALTRCRELIREIDKEEYYELDAEDDLVITRKIIAKRLTLMLKAVHIGGPKSSPEAFAEMLLAHVHDREMTYLALEGACRAIEQTEKWVQSISEVLEKIEEHEEKWRKRNDAIGALERVSRETQKMIREAQAGFKLEQARERARRAGRELDSRQYHLRWAREQAGAKQETARKAHQEVEQAFDLVEEKRACADQAFIDFVEANEALRALEGEAADKAGGRDEDA